MANTWNAVQEISTIKTRFKVKKVNNSYESGVHKVKFRDLEWAFVPSSDGVDVYVFERFSKESREKLVFANFHLKIISSQTDEILFTRHFGPQFCCPDFGFRILDDTVIKEENGICLLEVEIEAGPLQEAIGDEWVKMETIQQPCQGFSNGEFRFVLKMSCFLGLCSPEITFNDITCMATFVKQNNNFKVQLWNIKNLDSCQAIVTCQLLSYNPTANSLQSRKSLAFPVSSVYDIFIVDWTTFTSSANQFIENNAFVVEIKFKQESVKGLPANAKKRPAPTENNLVELECPVCLESIVGKNISSTPCGHIFCTPCVSNALQKRAVCPMCNRCARSTQLRETFLPLK